jgi:hypothetical protein
MGRAGGRGLREIFREVVDNYFHSWGRTGAISNWQVPEMMTRKIQ